LFAAGEVACTGVHGANRLASNSLLEGLVFGARAATAMQEAPAVAGLKPDRRMVGGWRLAAGGWRLRDGEPGDGVLDIPAVRDLMWRSVGLFRTRDGLLDAFTRLERAYAAERIRLDSGPPSGDSWRRFNLLTVAQLIARAALRREESRGGHFRADFPDRNDGQWRFHAVDQVIG
jgi:L-aspartate oxidase